MSNLTRRFTYANVAATLALVFSMTGGALAASHYLVNSTKQINPKVLRALKGAKGPSGAAGAVGAAGSPGSPGAAGATGPTGRQGTAGLSVEGEPGEPGRAGATGSTGPTGPLGATGAGGNTGEKGLEGERGPEGKQGPTGGPGATGEKGGTGATGPTGETTSPLAFAHVSEKDKLSETRNVENVEEPEDGIFCLSGITGTLHNVVATIDYNEAVELSDISATLGTADKTCPEGTQVTVETSATVFEHEEIFEKPESQGFFLTVN